MAIRRRRSGPLLLKKQSQILVETTWSNIVRTRSRRVRPGCSKSEGGQPSRWNTLRALGFSVGMSNEICISGRANKVERMSSYTLEPVGFIRSTVKGRADAPRQGAEGAPDAWLEIEPQFAEALLEIEIGHELVVITWLHEARRDVLKGHPRSDKSRPLTGVFYTRSPARPNPLGLHPVTVREIDGTRVKIGPIEVFDGTPVVDIKSASTRADG
jgi:tRNA-Thr(GGU) m(6)t(6)A37 methyltransferase TsaA